MDFKIQRKENENIHKYPTDNVEIAHKFSEHLKEELHEFLMGTVIFGSSVRREDTKTSDIDVLVVTNDLDFQLDEALIEGYRIIVERIILKTSPKLHITSMTYSAFWEYVKAGDPVAVNILRDGVAMIDKGFFNPLQRLLKQGRIRPSEESLWRYFGRAPKTLLNSRWHILQATLDLYWSVIDAGHAALMRKNLVPPTPEHVADSLDKAYVQKGLMNKKYVQTMRKFYTLMKDITHRKIKEVKGPEYEKLYHEADDFVKQMKKLIMQGKF